MKTGIQIFEDLGKNIGAFEIILQNISCKEQNTGLEIFMKPVSMLIAVTNVKLAMKFL